MITTLTGDFRLRTGWRRRLILQVEELHEWLNKEGDGHVTYSWRDAKLEDMQTVFPLKFFKRKEWKANDRRREKSRTARQGS